MHISKNSSMVLHNLTLTKLRVKNINGVEWDDILSIKTFDKCDACPTDAVYEQVCGFIWGVDNEEYKLCLLCVREMMMGWRAKQEYEEKFGSEISRLKKTIKKLDKCDACPTGTIANNALGFTWNVDDEEHKLCLSCVREMMMGWRAKQEYEEKFGSEVSKLKKENLELRKTQIELSKTLEKLSKSFSDLSERLDRLEQDN